MIELLNINGSECNNLCKAGLLQPQCTYYSGFMARGIRAASCEITGTESSADCVQSPLPSADVVRSVLARRAASAQYGELPQAHHLLKAKIRLQRDNYLRLKAAARPVRGQQVFSPGPQAPREVGMRTATEDHGGCRDYGEINEIQAMPD